MLPETKIIVRYGRRAVITPAPWRFREMRNIPRGHAMRIAAAARIRALRREARIGFDIRRAVLRQQREWKAQCLASVWTGRWAVGCIHTGELFRHSSVAARRFKTSTTAITRCCADGRNLPGKMIQFIWLNGPRWLDWRLKNRSGGGSADCGGGA